MEKMTKRERADFFNKLRKLKKLLNKMDLEVGALTETGLLILEKKKENK